MTTAIDPLRRRYQPTREECQRGGRAAAAKLTPQQRRAGVNDLRGVRCGQPDVENRRLAATQHDGVVLAVAVEVDRQRWFSCGCRFGLPCSYRY